MTVVFHPIDPLTSLSNLIFGCCMTLLATVVIRKIHQNSKNTFAYIFMGTSLLTGVSLIGFAFTNSFTTEIVTEKYGTEFFERIDVHMAFGYLYFIS